MSAYSVLEVTPTRDDWVPSYVSSVGGIVTAHGGTYLARTTTHERLEGTRDDPALRIIIEWPSMQAAKAFMNDPAYAPYLEARTAGSVSHHFLVEATDDLT